MKKLSSSSEYDDFLADLPETECRWAVYDLDFQNEEGGQRNKIIFFQWYVVLQHKNRQKTLFARMNFVSSGAKFSVLHSLSDQRCDNDVTWFRSPDGAKIKDKMVTASSREALRRSLVGIAVEVQGTDYSEVAHATGGFCFHHLTSPIVPSPSTPPYLLFFYPQSWIRQSACVDYLPLIILHSSPTHFLVFACRSVKFYRSAVGNKALSHYRTMRSFLPSQPSCLQTK